MAQDGKDFVRLLYLKTEFHEITAIFRNSMSYFGSQRAFNACIGVFSDLGNLFRQVRTRQERDVTQVFVLNVQCIILGISLRKEDIPLIIMNERRNDLNLHMYNINISLLSINNFYTSQIVNITMNLALCMVSKKKIAFIGAAGRVNTTAIANFSRFPESKEITMSMYDINRSGMNDTIAIARRGMDLTGNRYEPEIAPTIIDAIEDADLILFCALAPPVTEPPFNIHPSLGNVVLMEQIIEIAENKAAGDYKIINFANPTDKLAMMAKTLHPDIEIYSLCTGPEEFKRTVMMFYDIPLEQEERLDIDWIGCNHYGFVPSVRIDGQDIIEELKERADFDWRNFKGLRYGDSYDFATNLSLLKASGYLTVPIGHVQYWHQGIPGVSGSGRFRPAKELMLMMSTSKDPDATPELYWELMDSWGTRQVVVSALSILELKDSEFWLQAPNQGLISDLPDEAFIETPGKWSDGVFIRKQFDIPRFMEYVVRHEALGRYLVSKAIAKQNYEELVRALMIKRSDISIPAARKIICEKWDIKNDLDDLYKFPNDRKYAEFPL